MGESVQLLLTQRVHRTLDALNEVAGTGTAHSREECRNAINAANCMADAPHVEAELLLDDRWNSVPSDSEQLLHHLKLLQDRIAALEGRWSIPFAAQAVSRFSNELAACKDLLQKLGASCSTLSELAGCFTPSTLEATTHAIAAAKTVSNGLPAETTVLLNSAWNEENPTALALIETAERLQSEKPELEAIFKTDAFSAPVAKLLAEFEPLSRNLLRFLMPKFWRLRKSATAMHQTKATVPQLVANIKRLSNYKEDQSQLKAKADDARALFGEHWKDQSSDTKTLRAFSQWITEFRQCVVQGYLTESAISVVSEGPDRQWLQETIRQTADLLQQVNETLSVASSKLGFDNLGLTNGTLENQKLLEIVATLELWMLNLALLDDWIQWRKREGLGDISNLATQLIGSKASVSAISSDFAEARNCIEGRDALLAQEQDARRCFGRLWLGEDSSVEELKAFSRWAVEFRKYFLLNALTPRSAELVQVGVSREAIRAAENKVGHRTDEVDHRLRALAERIGFNAEAAFGKQWDAIQYSAWGSQLEQWQAKIDTLTRWAQFVLQRESLQDSCARYMVAPLERDEVEPEDAVLTFELDVAESLLRIAFQHYPILKQFVAEVHERKIDDFARIDRELQRLNRQRLARLLFDARPSLNSVGALAQSESGTLVGEFKKKRRHMPIRKLLGKAGKLIQNIKPCFMMSPLSIAQFLELGNLDFDTVIFDEASQVRPEDALGALLRGRQLVVMGDTKQLPPTSFFDKIDSDDEEDEEEEGGTSIVDIESILHQCQRSYDTKHLRWHYRSRHESLIAVSNQLFYDNHLLIYPSVAATLAGVGLELRLSEGSVYDRGKSAQNRDEARMVVAAAMEHLRLTPQKSLGIGAFSIKQQQAILDEIEKVLRLNPEMQDYFNSKHHEYCFVKNLETIQGDERDVIFISVGYGKAQDGRVLTNFGPINKEGGHRRLNVLMTRARERCVIFSNFGAEDLSTDAKTPFGVRALKQFLDYARTRQINLPVELNADTESPFEDSVREFLEAHGHEVSTQVGCAEFRIDLAIVDPEHPGRYLLAAECDGSKYHTLPVARDRDRLRQQVLENMGWRKRIHRIWSTDWFHNFPMASKKLLEAIEQARLLPRNEISAVEPALLTPLHIEEVIESVDHVSASGNGIEPTAYESCKTLKAQLTSQLYDSSPSELAKAVTEVVEVESPVHIEEIIRRIRSICGLRKAGGRIRSAIEHAASVAQSHGTIKKSGDFYWSVADSSVTIRKRTGEMVNAETIADEEIGAAFQLLLKKHFATPEQPLIQAAARLFGFQAVHDATATRFRQVLQSLIRKGKLRKNGQQMIELVAQ